MGGAKQVARTLRAAHLVAALVALGQLDNAVQSQHPAKGFGLKHLDVLELRALVVKRRRNLQVQQRRWAG